MTRLSRLCAFLLLAALSACASVPERAAPAAPLTILISIDGFAADYLDRGVTPHLSGLAANGARGAMRPSFPSKTFPNHYTLVTGLRPDRHGVVDNNMEDPQIPGVSFKLSDKAAVADARWWNDGTPIWVSAERAGVKSATMFWPGSEAAIQGVRPSYWRPFDQALPAVARVDQVLAWLDLPTAARPALITLYFDEVDTAGHWGGPDSAQVGEALAKTDAALARLSAGLAARSLAANLVIVADHGMAPTGPQRAIYLEDILPDGAARTLAMGAFMNAYPTAGREAEAERALLKPHPHMQCWRKGEIPQRFHYGAHRRVPPIFCLPDTGWEITTRAWVAKRPIAAGNHGFDPFAPEMRAVFIGVGPSFRRGVAVPDFDNVDVYPLVSKLVGVRPEPNDGDLDELAAALAR